MSSCTKEEVEVILQAVFNSNNVRAYNCDALDTLYSLTGSPSLNVRFENEASSNIKIQWIDFQGQLQTYKDALEPGDDYFVQSFQFHYWLISDSEGDCIGIYSPNSLLATNVVTFQDS